MATIVTARNALAAVPPWASGGERAGVALVCFPHAGGSAVTFRSWQATLGAAIAVRPFEYAGHGFRFGNALARCRADVVREAAAVAEALLRDHPRLVLFGHSMGATIAYETALTMERRGLPLPELVLSARVGPSCNARPMDPTASDADLIASLKARGGTPAEVFESPELLALILPILRGDYALLSEPLLTQPIRTRCLLLGGRFDADVPEDALAAWRETVTGPSVSLRIVAGGHMYLDDRDLNVPALVADWICKGAPGADALDWKRRLRLP